jgi:hypothetical protein
LEGAYCRQGWVDSDKITRRVHRSFW